MNGSTETPAAASFSGRDLACRRGERLVFRKLAFAIPPGGVLILRGPNGSGKSSLLRLMAGLLKPAEGHLAWNGEAIERDPDRHRERLAFLSHLDALKPGLTAAENLRFWCGNEAVGPALKTFGIGRLADRPARLLSAGQRRRLALARIAANPCPLWLLDEPTSGLDEEAAALFATALARHRARGGLAAIALHGPGMPEDVSILNLAADPGAAAAGSAS